MRAALMALGRATAWASPWMLALSAAASLIVITGDARDRARDRRGFLREVALNPAFSVDHLMFLRAAKDPIQEALRMIANPETSTEIKGALRRALAGVL